MIRRAIQYYIEYLWKGGSANFLLKLFEAIIFLILNIAEYFYRIIFFVVIRYKKLTGSMSLPDCKVISVGNLSAGGTGKSVFVHFLVDHVHNHIGFPRLRTKATPGRQDPNHSVAILLRGYKRSKTSKHPNVIVSDGKHMLCDQASAGDEAWMLAEQVTVPIVVGTNRYASAQLLQSWFGGNQKITFILDDAYQNFSLKKDFDILLLDARKPFENGHCFPAGRLREKDYTRANAIVLTHADAVNKDRLEEIKKKELSLFDTTKIFTGRHKPTQLLQCNKQSFHYQSFHNKPILVTAGIGSFDGFLATVKQVGLSIGHVIQYQDHQEYHHSDVTHMLHMLSQHNCHAIITTAKDWAKLEPILNQPPFQEKKLLFFVLSVEFEFLSPQEYSFFIEMIKRL